MRDVYLKLFNYLSYKYLVETEARNIPIKDNTFNSIEVGDHVHIKQFSQEEIMFKSYVAYMYYLCLIKREDFNFE